MLKNRPGSALNELPQRYLSISIAEQKLQLIANDQILFDVNIATATNGAGELSGSECTPRGWHKIRAKIGRGCAENTVFIARRPSGEIYSQSLQDIHPERDWILSRIMWLSGLQVGFNRLGEFDTMHRYIYIHGCPDSDPMGIPSSHGCIKMHNSDVMVLFDRVEVGIPVLISEKLINEKRISDQPINTQGTNA